MGDPKDNILKKAQELFQRFGYNKTTLTDIAQSVGKVKTAIYYYFSGKEEIFAQLVKIEAEQFLSKLMNAVKKENSAIDQLECYVRTRIELMEKIATRYKFLKGELFQLLPLVETNRAEIDLQEIDFVTKIFETGIEQNEFHSDNPAFIAKLLMYNLKSLEIQMYVTDQLPVNEDNKNEFIHYLLYGAITKIPIL